MSDEVPDEIILKRCFICGWFTCSTEHKIEPNTLEFIKKARDKHDYTFDYSKSVYVNNCTKIIIMCAYHGEFLQPSTKHINRGDKCRKCSGRDSETAKQNFIRRIQELGGKVLGMYVNSNTNVKCLCEKGHVCTPTPSNIKSGKGMCKVCTSGMELSKQNFTNKIQELGGKVLGEYINNSTHVKCICKKGHICFSVPGRIQQGSGMCSICSQVGYSKTSIEWLTHIEKDNNIKIQHAENGGEYKIGKYKADGYCKENNTVYEFHGDFWHGNPKFYFHEDINVCVKKSFGVLLKKTLHKELFLRNKGYNYKCIWECEWNLR